MSVFKGRLNAVKLIKLFFILLFLAGIIMLVSIYYLTPTIDEKTFVDPLLKEKPSYDTYTTNSTLQSLDSKNRPFNIHSEKMIKLGDEIYKLEGITGVYQLTNKNSLLLYANLGEVNNLNKTVFLHNKVKLLYDDYTIQTHAASVNLNDYSTVGYKGINMQYGNIATIDAQKFFLKPQSKTLYLNGNVRILIKDVNNIKSNEQH